MTRTVADRVASVRGLLAAADRVHRDRALLAPAIASATGLTDQGVELGFDCLERAATGGDLSALVEDAGNTAHVHVILSANVFVAPLRAIAIARAAAERVTVRPSARDPVLARALVREAEDPAIRVVDDRGVGDTGCSEIHVYGRDETVAAVRAGAPAGVRVRGHGAGLGVVVVGQRADLDEAAELVASDVVPFDQRGCLSPRVVVAVGDPARAERLAEGLHRSLLAWDERVPRGALHEAERVEAALWQETMRFAGTLSTSPGHAVAITAPGSPVIVPPSGRHVSVGSSPSWDSLGSMLAPFARFVVSLGTDEPERARTLAPAGARVAALGRMQRPPLDGPVDRRS